MSQKRMPGLISLTRDEKSLLLFFETCMTDGGCRVNTLHMNDDDREIAERWKEKGLIAYGRLPFDAISCKKTHFVVLYPSTLKRAYEVRAERAGRMVARLAPELLKNRVGLHDGLTVYLDSLGRKN